jgi:uncharacterized protein (TIGR03067 family)
MPTRLLIAVLAVMCLTAFAPAPFPRPRREREETDLNRIQGTWRIIDRYQWVGDQKTKPPATTTHIRIAGENWFSKTGQNESGGWRIRVDPTKKPCHIDWVNANGQPSYVGLVRRRGDVIEVMYHSVPDRPASFEAPPANTTLLIMQREQ